MAQETYTITVGDQEVELRFDMKSVGWFERKFGHALIQAITQHTGVELSIWLLLAGMRGAGKEATYDTAEALIQSANDAGKGNWTTVTKQMMEALRHFGFIPKKEFDPEEVRPLVAGRSSGARGE